MIEINFQNKKLKEARSGLNAFNNRKKGIRPE